MMINGTVEKHWSATPATRALSAAEAGHAVDDDGLGEERTGTCLGDSNAAQATRRGFGKTRLVAGGGQICTSENEEGPRRGNFGGPPDEVKLVARDR